MERYEADVARKAGRLLEELSLYAPCRDAPCLGGREPGLAEAKRGPAAHMPAEPRGKKMNGTLAPPPPGDAFPAPAAAAASGKVYQAAAAPQFRPANGSGRAGGGQEPGGGGGRGEPRCEEGLCTRSEVALPCYGGFAEASRRYSAESARHSAGSAYEGIYVAKAAGSYPAPPGSRAHAGPEGKYSAASPRASRAAAASSSAPEPSKFSSPRSSLSHEKFSSPRASLVQHEGSALSPRSSYASTASDTSKHSSPRASLNSSDGGSKPSSNRTSGISMGYDQRHASPRSSTASQYSCTASPRSSYSDSRYGPPGHAELEGAGAGHGLPLVSPRASVCSQDGRTGPVGNCHPAVISPRSSISSHSSRSSRSSRGSMSAYPELQLPSPRSSMLGPGLQEENTAQEHGDAYHRVRAQSPPRHEQQHPAASNPDSAAGALASYTYSATKGAAPAPKFKLPYQVTPSRESGPSQAERRLEALTLELEKELEMHMKKEYFGICIKCGKGVYGASQACQAMGNLYHTNCFTCCSCGRRLRGKAFYNVNGKVYCEEDFLYSGFQQTADKCFVCGHLIMEMILQALGKSYHPGCFRCVVCNECLDGVPFTVDVENNIYCVKDYHTVFAPKCASCNQPILPAQSFPNQGSEETIRVVSMDRDYHVECYHCEDCGLQLNDEEGHRCYPLEGHLLCHGCHIRRLNIKVPPHPPPNYPMHVTEL